jgi:predicted nucleic acid-binding protein
MGEDQRSRALAQLGSLRPRIDAQAPELAFTPLAELAAAYALSVYDAAYLDLAKRKDLALACKDGALRAAAWRAGVRLWA